MSKAHDPHWRYVAFRLDGAAQRLSRRAIGNALKGRFRKLDWPEEDLPQLTRFEHPHGIVKVHHYRLADCRAGLPTMDWAIEAAARVPFQTVCLSSSGTIKTLTQRLDILQKRAEPGKGPGKAPNKGSGNGSSGSGKGPGKAPRQGANKAPAKPARRPIPRGPAPAPGRR